MPASGSDEIKIELQIFRFAAFSRESSCLLREKKAAGFAPPP
jgi:hypothetical protein